MANLKQILTDLCLIVTSTSSSQNMRCSKVIIAPMLTHCYLQLRLQCCDKYIEMEQEWKNVIFSDEENLN